MVPAVSRGFLRWIIVRNSGANNFWAFARRKSLLFSSLEAHEIEAVPAGPYNPKGNGTDEGAFSQMKRALGVVRFNLSSPRALARSVLEKLISLYICGLDEVSPKRVRGGPSKG
jgi:hypothetical protein